MYTLTPAEIVALRSVELKQKLNALINRLKDGFGYGSFEHDHSEDLKFHLEIAPHSPHLTLFAKPRNRDACRFVVSDTHINTGYLVLLSEDPHYVNYIGTLTDWLKYLAKIE